jgi:hypothetical protein
MNACLSTENSNLKHLCSWLDREVFFSSLMMLIELQLFPMAFQATSQHDHAVQQTLNASMAQGFVYTGRAWKEMTRKTSLKTLIILSFEGQNIPAAKVPYRSIFSKLRCKLKSFLQAQQRQ